MQRYYLALWILPIVLFIQCNSQDQASEGTLALPFRMGEKYSSVRESEYKYFYNFIPLETKEESLLSEIFSIKKYDDYFYIHSLFNKTVMIFSADGKFIKKIPMGRGPGEIMDPLYITIDEHNKELEILDFFRQIKKYTLKGEYIGSRDCNMCLEFEKLGDSYLFHLFAAQNQPYCFSIQNTKKETTYYIDQEKIKQPPLMAYSHLFKTDTIIYFHTDFNNIVYSISVNNLVPKPYATLIHLCKAKTIKSLPESKIDELCMSRNMYINMLNFNVLHNGSTIYSEMITANNTEAFLYNIDNQKIYKIDDGLKEGIVGSHENYQYKYITPSQIEYYLQDENIKKNKLLYEKITELSSSIKEEDNPVIVEIQISKN